VTWGKRKTARRLLNQTKRNGQLGLEKKSEKPSEKKERLIKGKYFSFSQSDRAFNGRKGKKGPK